MHFFQFHFFKDFPMHCTWQVLSLAGSFCCLISGWAATLLGWAFSKHKNPFLIFHTFPFFLKKTVGWLSQIFINSQWSIGKLLDYCSENAWSLILLAKTCGCEWLINWLSCFMRWNMHAHHSIKQSVILLLLCCLSTVICPFRNRTGDDLNQCLITLCRLLSSFATIDKQTEPIVHALRELFLTLQLSQTERRYVACYLADCCEVSYL